MNNSSFKSKFPRRQATQWTAKELPGPRVPLPSASLRVDDGKARAVVSIPKRAYTRDERLRDMCRAMPCQQCGASDGTVTWAHSNQGQHGHGRSIKACDRFVAAMCWTCHSALDQGSSGTRAEKVATWTAAHRRTVEFSTHAGTWPAGIPIPTPEEL